MYNWHLVGHCSGFFAFFYFYPRLYCNKGGFLWFVTFALGCFLILAFVTAPPPPSSLACFFFSLFIPFSDENVQILLFLFWCWKYWFKVLFSGLLGFQLTRSTASFHQNHNFYSAQQPSDSFTFSYRWRWQ